MDILTSEHYQEAPENSLLPKERYLSSLEQFIARQHLEARHNRDRYITPEKLLAAPETYRRDFYQIVGIPIDWDRSVPSADCRELGRDSLCTTYRICIRTMSDFDFFGILQIPHTVSGKLPLVIAQHGGGGTPEYCLDMYGNNSYCHFGRRALERGIAVFAPQLLLWQHKTPAEADRPSFAVPYDRDKLDRQLRQCGLSIIGVEIYNIMRSLDYLCTLECIDSRRIGMMGLSYGGFFSLYTAAADVRIRSIYSAAAFNDRSRVALSDWMFPNQTNYFHDAEVAGLCVPRNLVIECGLQDRVFDFQWAEAEAQRAKRYYQQADAEENFLFRLWNGGHTFNGDAEGFAAFFAPLIHYADNKEVTE